MDTAVYYNVTIILARNKHTQQIYLYHLSYIIPDVSLIPLSHILFIHKTKM